VLKKQEFYEGAALYQLLRTNAVERVSYAHPFFILNDKTAILLKYSTRKDSPWNFTFTELELSEFEYENKPFNYFAGLICGSDGVVALSLTQLTQLAEPGDKSFRVGCYRKHDHQYEVRGPLGALRGKISRNSWKRILNGGELM
jgi:hypothetical protein